MLLSAKTVKDRAIKIAANITSQQITDINSAPEYSIACDESKNVSDIEQIVLLCRYVNSAGPQKEIIEVIPLKGQTRGEDICEAVLDCLKNKEINTTHLVWREYWWGTKYDRSTAGVCEFTSEVAG